MLGSVLSLLIMGTPVVDAALTSSEFPFAERALMRATSHLFDMVEDQDQTAPADFYAEAWATNLPIESWDAARAAALVDYGPVRNLTAYNITWYPVDTLMGSVDFVGRYDGGDSLVCGYVLWEFVETGRPRLRGYQANYVDTRALAGKSQEDIGEALLEANCAFTEIDANFALSKR